MVRKSGHRFSDKTMLKRRKTDGSNSTKLDQTLGGGTPKLAHEPTFCTGSILTTGSGRGASSGGGGGSTRVNGFDGTGSGPARPAPPPPVPPGPAPARGGTG